MNVESKIYDNNYDGLSKSKDKIVLPSSTSRVVRNDEVMKDDEDSENELEINSIHTAIRMMKHENSTNVISEQQHYIYGAPKPNENSSNLNDEKDYDSPISNEEVILNHIIPLLVVIIGLHLTCIISHLDNNNK